MGSTRTLLPCLLTALLVLGLGTGCGDDEPATPTPAKPQKAAAAKPMEPAPLVQKKAPRSIKEQLENTVELPDFYPKDAPVYPGAKASSTGWQSGRVSAVFSTSDSAVQVTKYASKFLKEQGWSEVASSDMPNGQVVQGFKLDDDRKIMVLVSEVEEAGDKVTVIAVSTDP